MVQREDTSSAWLEIRVQFPVGPLIIRKVAGYGWPGRFANAVLPRGDEGSTPLPSAWCAEYVAPMVKRTSCLASNEVFRVRVLVGVLNETVIYGVRGVAVTARLAVNQKVRVRLSPGHP